MKTTTIRIDEEVREKAAKIAKSKQLRGGLSGLIDILLKDCIKKEEKIKLKV